MLDRDVVEWAYRLFLDREPESDAAVLGHMKSAKNVRDLRSKLLASDEYRRKNASVTSPALSGSEPPMHIDVELTPDELERLFSHVEATWLKLGQEEPHWSVSSGEQFKQANIANSIDTFFSRGQAVVNNFVAALSRSSVELSDLSTAIDFGSGLCRNAMWLAKLFDDVHGYDISKSHLDLSRVHLEQEGIENIHLHQLTLADLDTLERVDVVFSVIVLQHNPPPLIAVLVERLLEALNPGGVAYFQVPTYRAGYSFRVTDYLEGIEDAEGMEMHVLPQARIFEIAERCDCRVLEVLEDTWAGSRPKEVSNTFLLRRGA